MLNYTIHTHLECPRCHHKNCFTVYSNGSHCFSCKYTSRNKHRDLFIEKQFSQATPKIPENDLPEKAPLSMESLLFLEKKRITSYLRLHYSIYEGFVYNHFIRQKERRIILPVWFDRKIVGYQARALGDQKPKYLGAIFNLEESVIFYSKKAITDTIIITEDILSAIRLSKFANSVSLLGTSFDRDGSRLFKLLSCGPRNFILWLDGDEAGTKAAINLKKQLLLYGNVNIIYTREDPKNLSDRQIKEYLSLSGPIPKKAIRKENEFISMANIT
jgi:DNA primase